MRIQLLKYTTVLIFIIGLLVEIGVAENSICPSNKAIEFLIKVYGDKYEDEFVRYEKVRIIKIGQNSKYCPVMAEVTFSYNGNYSFDSPAVYTFMIYKNDFGEWIVKKYNPR